METFRRQFSDLEFAIRETLSGQKALKVNFETIKSDINKLTADASTKMTQRRNETLANVKTSSNDVCCDALRSETEQRLRRFESDISRQSLLPSPSSPTRANVGDVTPVEVTPLSLVVSNLENRINEIEAKISSKFEGNYFNQNSFNELKSEFQSLSNHLKNDANGQPSPAVSQQIDDLTKNVNSLREKVTQMERSVFSGAVKNAEPAVMPDKNGVHEKKEAAHSMHEEHVLTGVVALANDVKLIQKNLQIQIDELKKNTNVMQGQYFDNFEKELTNFREVFDRHVRNDLTTRIEDIESALVRIKRVLPPNLQNQMNSTAVHQGDVVHDLVALTGIVAGLNDEFWTLKNMVADLRTKSEQASADHNRLHLTAVHENAAIKDLASLTQLVSTITFDFKNFSNDFNSVKRQVDELKRSGENFQLLYDSDHKKLNAAALEEKIAIHDLASLASIVSRLSRDFDHLKSEALHIPGIRDKLLVLDKMNDEVEEVKKTIFVLKLATNLVESDHGKLNYTFAKEKAVINDLADLTRVVSLMGADLMTVKKEITNFESRNIELANLKNATDVIKRTSEECNVRFGVVDNNLETFKRDMIHLKSSYSKLKLLSDVFEFDHGKLNRASDHETVAIHDLARLTNFVSMLSKDVQDLKNAGTTNVDHFRQVLDGVRLEIGEVKKSVESLKMETRMSVDHGKVNHTADIKDLDALTNAVSMLGHDLQTLRQTSLDDRANMSSMIGNYIEHCQSMTSKIEKMRSDLDGLKPDFAGELLHLKRSLNATTVHQMSAVHDVAYLTDIIEELKNEMNNLKNGQNNFDQDARKIPKPAENILNEMRLSLKSTIDHQVKAVHDVALLSSVVDNLKANVDRIQNLINSEASTKEKAQRLHLKHSELVPMNADATRKREGTEKEKQNFDLQKFEILMKKIDGIDVVSTAVEELKKDVSKINDELRSKKTFGSLEAHTRPIQNEEKPIKVDARLKPLEENGSGSALSEIGELKKSYEVIRSHQLKAVHDVADVVDVVESLKRNVQTCRDSLKTLEPLIGRVNVLKNELKSVQVSLQSQSPPVQRNESIPHLTQFDSFERSQHQQLEQQQQMLTKLKAIEDVVSDLRRKGSTWANVSEDVFNLKQSYDLTRHHQQKAVHDIASMADAMERFKNDLEEVKKTFVKNLENENLKREKDLDHKSQFEHHHGGEDSNVNSSSNCCAHLTSKLSNIENFCIRETEKMAVNLKSFVASEIQNFRLSGSFRNVGNLKVNPETTKAEDSKAAYTAEAEHKAEVDNKLRELFGFVHRSVKGFLIWAKMGLYFVYFRPFLIPTTISIIQIEKV